MKKKFGFPDDDVEEAIHEILQISDIVEIYAAVEVDIKDKSDIDILRAAVGSECNYLVTGDGELRALKSVGATRITSPAQFLSILKEE